MACKFEEKGDQLVCANCGLSVKASLFQKGKPFVVCTKPSRAQQVPAAVPVAARGLGDMVSDTLASVGITKDLAQAAASAVGVQDCGCNKRQAYLNKLGEKIGLPSGRKPDAAETA
jgi:hypothetical protein